MCTRQKQVLLFPLPVTLFSLEFALIPQEIIQLSFKIIMIFFYDIVWQETMQYLGVTNFTSCPLCDTFILVFIAQSLLCVYSLAGKWSIPQKQKTSKQTSSIQWRSQQERRRDQEKWEAGKQRGSVGRRPGERQQHTEEGSKGHQQEEENRGGFTCSASSQSGEPRECEASQDSPRQQQGPGIMQVCTSGLHILVSVWTVCHFVEQLPSKTGLNSFSIYKFIACKKTVEAHDLKLLPLGHVSATLCTI